MKKNKTKNNENNIDREKELEEKYENERKEKIYNSRKDYVIKLLLIIIIIILLIHNCITTKINKDVLAPVPNGNVDIFEIQCLEETCSKTDNAGNIVPAVKEENGDITVLDNNLKWESKNLLNIFTNPLFNMEKVIAPGSSNTYQFIIKNDTKYNITYKIKFIENNEYHINMKYKLRKDGLYIAGSEDNWVNYDELDISNLFLNSSSSNTYYLDWKWIDSDNDTDAGAVIAPYELTIKIEAVQHNG